MKVLFCGTPGIQKKLVLRNLRDVVRRLFPEERIFASKVSPSGAVAVPIIEDLLYPSGSPIAFLKQSQNRQKDLWREKFAKIVADFNRAQTEHHFLGLHFTFRYEQVPSCPADFGMLIDWCPDCIVTLIDDAYCVRERIHRGGYKSFTLTELVQWRAEETLIGDLLARIVKPKSPIPNYVLSVNHPAEMLARLLLEPTVARIYMSYPISSTRNDEEKRRAIDHFRRFMHKQKNCAAFDPLTIDELPPVREPALGEDSGGHYEYNTASPSVRWPILDADLALTQYQLTHPIRIPVEELNDVRDAIDAQVKNRDIRLVDQAHYLIVYRPTAGSSNAKLSSGVQGEIDYAAETGCPVIWYVKKGTDFLPESPFVDKRPESNPDFFYDEDDRRFWERIAQLHHSVDRSRDCFLR